MGELNNNFTGKIAGDFPCIQLENINTRLFLSFLPSLFEKEYILFRDFFTYLLSPFSDMICLKKMYILDYLTLLVMHIFVQSFNYILFLALLLSMFC